MDSTFPERPDRNDPCPCGSGKKFKKCCIDRFDEKPQPVGKEESQSRDEPPKDDPPSKRASPELEREGDALEAELSGLSNRRDEAEVIRRFLSDHQRMAPSVREMIQEYVGEIIDERKEPLSPAELLGFMDFLRQAHPKIFWKTSYGGFQRCYLLAEAAGEEGITRDWIEALAAEPDREPDITFPLIDLFLATGRRKQLLELIPRVVPILRASPNVVNADTIFSPFSSVLIDDLLSQPRETRDIPATLRRWYHAIDYPMPDNGATEVPEVISWIEGPFHHFDFGISQSREEAHESLERQSFSFMRHLHETVGMEWFAADAWRIWATDYLLHKMGEKKVRKDLDVPDPAGFLTYLNRNCGDFLGPYIPKWFGTLNAVFHLAGYLHAIGVWPTEKMESWQGMCRKIFQENYQSINNYTSWAFAFEKFPLF